MSRRLWIAAALLVTLLCLLATIRLHRSGNANASAISATTVFLGYTNDPVKGRLARFCFSNASPVRIQRHYFYAYDFLAPTGWVAQGTQSFPDEGVGSLRWRRYGPVLRPGGTEIVAVAAPFTNTWRISFPFVEPENAALRAGVEAIPAIQQRGFLTNVDDPFRSKYWSDSGRIDP